MKTPIFTKSAVKCTFCGEVIPKGSTCYRWTGFVEGMFTGTESAHSECYYAHEYREEWQRGAFIRGSGYRKADVLDIIKDLEEEVKVLKAHLECSSLQ